MIRRRLVLAITVTVALAIGIGSWAVVASLEDRLVSNVDDQFRSGALSQEVRQGLSTRPFPSGDAGPDRGFEENRDVAVVRIGPNGAVVRAITAGTRSNPAPLPAAFDVDPDDGLVTVGSAEPGGPRYRAIAADTNDGGRLVIGISLADVDATLDEARRVQRLIGLLAVAAAALASWLLVRRAFSPIEGMIATAGRIADGDLTERTEVGDPTSEVGRLGAALDTMLDRIESAVEEKTRSEATMRRFVADASHELRTPLTSVRGYAELYRQGASDPDAVATGMERIEAEATRMSRLVEDLMLLARLDQEPPRSVVQPVDLTAVVGEAIDAARVRDGDRFYELDTEPDLVVPGVRHQLRQVLDNLLVNARLHTPTGTTVEVRARRDDAGVTIVVADDGPGFTADDRARAFDRFWRSTRADENPLDGSGLGLSIVKSLIEAHGGRVALDTAPTGGARFSIHLPAGDHVSRQDDVSGDQRP